MDLQLVGIRYWNDRRAPADRLAIVDQARLILEAVATSSGLAIHEPALSEELRTDDPIANLGTLGGAIAEAVATGLRAGRRIVVVGGNCTALPGVLGGMQDVYGPTARIGLVWFDAHGDFNTPRTTPSGMLGGMPVAVSAGLCYASWREGAHLATPLPTDRIVMVDVRNLDPEEAALVHASDVTVARVAPGFAGEVPLAEAVTALAARCEALYLHIDHDVLDASLTPSHGTKEPGGPGLAETLEAIDTVLMTGKVVALGLVAVNSAGEGGEASLASALALLRGSIASWARAGSPALPRE